MDLLGTKVVDVVVDLLVVVGLRVVVDVVG